MRSAVRVAMLAGLVFLSACGGGGGGAPVDAGAPAPAPGAGPGQTPDPGTPAPDTTRITGTAAIGTPLSNTAIASICGNGTQGPGTTTDAQGAFELTMDWSSCPGPWLVSVPNLVQAPIRSWAIAGQPRTQPLHVNITPLTQILMETLLTVYLNSTNPTFDELKAAWNGFDPATRQAALDEALAAINRVRPPGTPLLTLDNILKDRFNPQAGDAMDDLLEYLRANIGTVSTPALLELVRGQGGDLASGKPWKTLFGEAQSVAFTTTDCTSFGSPVSAPTVTLRMEASDLLVGVTFADDPSLDFDYRLGPGTGRTEYQMVLQGTTPYVRLSAARTISGTRKSFSIFPDADTQKITVSNAGSSRTCTLATPLRRADLVAFQTAARVLSAVPATGTSGTCAADAAGPAYTYEVTPLGDVRLNGTSVPADFLNGERGHYSESMQYGMGGPGLAFQVQLTNLPTRQVIQPYWFGTLHAMYCTTAFP